MPDQPAANGAPQGTPQSTAPGAPAPVKTDPTELQQAPPPEKNAGDNKADRVEDLPQWAQKLISDTRKEAGDARVAAKTEAAQEAQQQLAKDIGKILGLVEDDKVDPDALLKQVQEAQAERTAAARELAVFRAASEAGGDPDALLDSNSFLHSIESVDPTDLGKIKAAISEAVKNNNRLAAVKSGSGRSHRSGTDAGGAGEVPITAEAFAKMSGSERNALYNSNPDLYNRLAGVES